MGILDLAILTQPGIPFLYDPETLLWVFIVACIGLVVMSFGIGANDVANSMGTSVGSGALSIRSALVIAGVMEFAGAVLLGQAVAQTIRNGISYEYCWRAVDLPELMLGMMATLLSSSAWLLAASQWGLPVSTTHTVVGGVIGFTVASQGWKCVIWGFDGFGGIALSWIISPLFAGFLGFLMHGLIAKFILKSAVPFDTAMKFIPILFTFTMLVVSSLIFFKTPISKNWPEWVSYTVVFGTGLLALVLSLVFGRRVMHILITMREAWEKKYEDETRQTDPAPPTEDHDFRRSENDMIKLEDPDDSTPLVRHEVDVERIIKEAEAGKIFCFFQIFSAALQAFAHGANDTANAIGPWATVYFLYTADEASSDSTPWWAMAIGAAGIVLGLALFGRNVMDTIASGITKVNFVRGFSIEYSSMLAVILASRMGFPISTTHCKVGSVLFVGLTNKYLYRFPSLAPAEPMSDELNVSWPTIIEIGTSWLVTVPIAALCSAGIFAMFASLLIEGYSLTAIGNATNSTNITSF